MGGLAEVNSFHQLPAFLVQMCLGGRGGEGGVIGAVFLLRGSLKEVFGTLQPYFRAKVSGCQE